MIDVTKTFLGQDFQPWHSRSIAPPLPVILLPVEIDLGPLLNNFGKTVVLGNVSRLGNMWRNRGHFVSGKIDR